MGATVTKIEKIVVTFERREDGGLRLWSDDVPGFVLSGLDAETVLADIVPALERMLSHQRGSAVRVKLPKNLLRDLQDKGVAPSPSGRRKRQFVAEVAA